MMIGTTKFYILELVYMALTWSFIQGHSCMKIFFKNGVHFMVDLDKFSMLP